MSKSVRELSSTPASGWTLVAVAAGAWLLLNVAVLAPGFGHTDVYYFKDAGINFAEGRGLVSRFTYGNPTFDLAAYAHYPPLYPLAFGSFEIGFGISALSSQAFNSLISIALGLGAFAVVLRAARAGGVALPWWAEGGLGLLLVVSGGFGPAPDRPDGMGVFLGAAAILSGSAAWRGSAILCGALAALAFLASPIAGVVTAVSTTIVIVGREGVSWAAVLMRLAAIAAAGTFGLALALAALLATDPGWVHSFLGVALGTANQSATGAGYFLGLLRGDVSFWFSGFDFATAGGKLELAKLGAMVVFMAVAMLVARGRATARLLTLAALTALLLFPAILVPYQTYYLAITAALVFVAWSTTIGAGEAGRPDPKLVIAAAATLSVLSAPLVAHDVLVRSNSGASLGRTAAFIRSHAERFRDPDHLVAVPPATYMAWREAGIRVLITEYNGFRIPENRARLGYIAMAYPGSGNLTEPSRIDFDTKDYVPIWRPQLPQPTTIFGVPFLRSSYTWEPHLLARRDCEACTKPIATQRAN